MSILVKLFEHNRWANLRAVESCVGLTDAQLDATVLGTAGTIRHTLLHIAASEQSYVTRLSGFQATYSDGDGWHAAEQLYQALDESGRALIALVGCADPDEVLRGEHQGRASTLLAATVYVQALNHATEHRAQIATILTQQGVEPPNFSGWAWATLEGQAW